MLFQHLPDQRRCFSLKSKHTPGLNLKKTLRGVFSILVISWFWLFAFPSHADAATKYWIGSAGGSFSSDSNWSTTSGGSNDTTAPGTDDVATFNGGNTNSAAIDANISVASIDMRSDGGGSGYTGTITQGTGKTITVGSSGWTQAAGTFTGADGGITLNGAYAFSGGTFNAGSQTISTSSAWTVNSGTINAQTSTLAFGDGASITGSHTLNNVTFSGFDVRITTASETTLTVFGTLTYSPTDWFQGNGGTIAAQGDINFSSGYFLGGTTTLLINGTGSQTYTSNGAGIGVVEINKASGTLNLSGTIAALTWTYTAGTINAGTSTVVFGHNSTITGSHTLNNISFSGYDVASTISSGSTLTASGNLVVNVGDWFNLNGSIAVQGNVTVTGGWVNWATSYLILNGSNNQIITTTAGSVSAATVTVNKISGIVTLASNLILNNSGQDLTLTSGTLDLAGYNLTVNDQFTVASGGTIKLQGGETVSAIDTMNGSVEYSGTGTYASGLPLGDTYGNLTISGSGTYTLDHNLDVNGDLTISAGTLDVKEGSDYDITVTGAWNTTGGTFVERSGTVTFDGSSGTHAITEAGNFYDLTINGSGATYTQSNNFTISGAMTVSNGTYQQGASHTLTVTGAYSQGGGTFTGADSGITLNSAYTLSGGTFNAGSQTITASSGWNYSGGTLNAQTGTVKFYTSGGTFTISGNQTFNNLQFANQHCCSYQTVTINSGDTVTVSGDLDISGGPTIINDGTIAVQSNISKGNLEISGTGSLLINGTGDQTFSGSDTESNGGGQIISVTIDKPSGTLNLSGTIALTNNNWTYIKGTVNAGTSTIVFRTFGSTTQTITGTQTLNNVTFANSHCCSDSAVVIADADTLTVSGTLKFASGGGTTSYYGNINAQGDVIIADDKTHGGTASLTLAGTANQTITSSGGDGTFRLSSTINKASGTVTLASNLNLNSSGQDLTLTSGTLDLAGYNLTVNDQFTVASGGTIKLQGGETVSTIDTMDGNVEYSGSGEYTGLPLGDTYNNLTFSGSGAYILDNNLTVNGNLVLSAGTLDVNNTSNYAIIVAGGWIDTTSGDNFIERAGTVTFTGDGTLNSNEAFYHLTLNGSGKTLTLGNNLDVNGALTISAGTLDASTSNKNITLASTWTNNGSFNARAGTVALDGGNQTITGSANTSFYNLTKSVTSAYSLTFNNALTTSVTNSTTLNGSSKTTRLSLLSDSSGTQWETNISNSGTRTIQYVDVKDSNNQNGTSVACEIGCKNSGNNVGWSFPIQGIVYQTDRVTPIGEGKTVAVSLDGATSTTGTTDTDGSYSIAGVSPTAGQVITVYLKDNTEKGVLAAVTDGSDITSLNLYQDSLTVRNDNSSSITNSNLDTANNVGDSNIDAIYTLDGSNLNIATGKSLLISTGTYVPGGSVSTHDLENTGTFNPEANTVTVSGSWTNTGTFNKGTSIVNFTSTSTETITPGSAFNVLTLNGNGGAWNLLGNLTVTTLNITQGTLDLNSYNLTATTLNNDSVLRMQGTETVSGADTDSGTVTFDGTGTYTSLPATTFYHLTFNGTGGSWTLNNDIDVNGTLTLTAGTLHGSSKTISVAGNFTKEAGTFNADTSTVKFDGIGQINSTDVFNHINVDTLGTVLLASALDVNGNLTITQGTLDVSSNNFAVTVYGNWSNSGTFTYRQGTVTLDGTNQTISGSTSFYNLTKEVSQAYNLTFQKASTQTITNMWTAKGATGQNLTLQSSESGSQWKISPHAYTLQYISIKDSNNVSGTSILAANDATNSGNNTAWAFPLVVTVYSDAGNTGIGAGKTVALSINGGTKVVSDTGSNSKALFNDGEESRTVSVSSGDILLMWIDDEAEKGVTVTRTNGTSLEFVIYQNRLKLQHEAGSNISNADLDTANNANDTDIDAIYGVTSTLTMQASTEIYITQGSTFSPGGPVAANDVSIQGAFDMSDNDVSVTGSWITGENGSFTGNNAITFNATAPETVTSNGSSFYNVTYNLTADGSITNSDAISITGTQTVNGSSGSEESDTTNPVISAITVVPGETKAMISWTTNESTDSKAEYGKGNTNTVSTDATMTLRHAITLSSLDANADYTYKVTSKDASSNSSTSESGTFTTLKAGTTSDTTAPTISSVSATSVTSSGASIAWATSEDAVGYVDYGETSTYNRGANPGTSTYKKDQTAIVTGLAPSTTYHYRVVAIDAAGNMSKSDDKTLTTVAEEATVKASEVLQDSSSRSSSDAPQLSSEAPAVTDITGTSVKITWKTNEKATSVVYYRELRSGSDPLKSGNPSYVTEHEVKLNGLKDATAYEYSVESQDSEGNKMQSKRYEFATRLPEVKNVSVQNLSSDAAQFVYVTESATSSVLELKNVLTGEAVNLEDDSLVLEHKVSLDNLEPDTEYSAVVLIKGSNDEVKKSLAYIFHTRPDTLDPLISTIETRSAIVEGEKDKVQTIITWSTNKTSTSQVEYNEGLTRGGEFKYQLPKSEDLVTKHVVVLPDMKPSTVYEYRVRSMDRNGKEIISEPRVLLTPQRKVSAFDLIVQNLEDTFGWTKQIGGG